MAETICLHIQEFTNKAASKEALAPHSNRVEGLGSLVVGVELADNTYLRGVGYDADRPAQTFALEWSSRKAERLAEFYDRFLTQPWDEESPGWNCNSFVTDVMNWNVYWFWDEPRFMRIKHRLSYRGTPERQKIGLRTQPPDETLMPDFQAIQLKDGQPYAIVSNDGIGHSMFGTPNPTLNLGVEGYQKPLTLRPHESTLRTYPGNVHEFGFQVAGLIPPLTALWARKKGYERKVY